MNKKFWESLYLFSSLFMIGLLFFILLQFLDFWVESLIFIKQFGLKELSFWLVIMIAGVTTIMQWMEGRIKAIIESIDILKGGKNDRGRKRKGK